MAKFLEDHKIKRFLSTHYHSSGNGQAESTNKSIIQNLKKRLTDAKGKWKEILPEVLWAYHITLKSSTGATQFSLIYGTEALIPIKVGETNIRFRYATKDSNDESMNTSLELLDERREAALVRLAAQKRQIERYYNRRSNLRYFNVRDLVPRKFTLNTRNPNEGKLGPNWEGLYQILEVTGKGSYKLRIINGEQLSNNCNVTQIKRYYC
ncbi:uncharacterized protein [Nicotiana sylvestris]|uniref:uncharacterized protein n=1 Tax=Nicotiana sylvestris TaxID=4096 RepID=UPI00388C7541